MTTLAQEEADRIEAERIATEKENWDRRDHERRVIAARANRIQDDRDRVIALAEFEIKKKERDAARAIVLAERAAKAAAAQAAEQAAPASGASTSSTAPSSSIAGWRSSPIAIP